MTTAPPRFLADVMLERLARWLRALGLDVASAHATTADRDLVRQAVAERRVLLTRDLRLAAEHDVAEVMVVRRGTPLEQLAEVVARFAVEPEELFVRCLLCNLPLHAAPDVDGMPARRCPGCGRVYWEGSHTRRMRSALERALPGRVVAGPPGSPSGPPPGPPPGP